MTPPVEALTTAMLSMAMDAASLRQQVIATNIANAGRADYVAHHVSFEAQLTDNERGTSLGMGGGSLRLAPIDLRMRVEPEATVDGQPREIQLDVEVAAMSQNAMHYQALIKGLNRHMSIMASAVSEGRR